MGSGTSLPSSSEIRRPEDYGRSTSQEAVGWPRLHSIAHQHAMCLSTRVAPVRRIEAAPQKGCRCLCSPSFREVAFFLGVPEITLQGKRGGSKAVSGTATVRRGRCKPVYPNFRAAKVAARDVLQVADDLHLGVPGIPRGRRSSAKADWSRSGEGPEPKLRGGSSSWGPAEILYCSSSASRSAYSCPRASSSISRPPRTPLGRWYLTGMPAAAPPCEHH
jgi:hypothetical protein